MTRLLETGPIIAPGAYHFAVTKRGGWRYPKLQAEAFVRAIEQSGWEPPRELLEGTGIPALWCDLEWQSFTDKVLGRAFRRRATASHLLKFLRRFIGRVEALTGVPCGYYTGRSYIKYRLRYAADLRLWACWLAAYVKVGKNRDRVPELDEWPEPIELEEGHVLFPDVWQFTGKGRCEWYRGGHKKSKIDRNLVRVA
jgi:GH25 family lysozyme M1 (1,4-beta-N-acetylmuramidase)